MVSLRAIPVFVGIALALLAGIMAWSVHAVRATRRIGLKAEDWAGDLLVWLLVFAAFVGGAFISYALFRP